jgi:hypothetical protein
MDILEQLAILPICSRLKLTTLNPDLNLRCFHLYVKSFQTFF